MTDNEVIKALEKWCDNKCKNVCPHLKICDKCVVTYIKSALDLIDRQKAEIESFRENCTKCGEKTTKVILSLQEVLGTARAEAIKEFCKKRGIEYVENDV